ncbi:hypothetical protein MTO96_033473 [Rhipicephalus appendiculatus]
MALQKVFVFPRLSEFDPNRIHLIMRSHDPEIAVSWLLGFVDLVCGADFEVLNSADKDGVRLQEVKEVSVEGCQQLPDQTTDSEPAATMDDFYVLLGIMLCNLSCPRNMNPDWFQNCMNDLVGLFPDVSEQLPVPLYDEAKADAISAFGEQCPQTRAAICRTILKGRFEGPMQELQQYVSGFWSFAGIEHAQLILEFLIVRQPWLIDAIPELKSKQYCLEEFLEVYQRLGADGPYMKLLDLPEAAKAQRHPLRVHVAAAYAVAVLDDWRRYRGVPYDRAEAKVFVKVYTFLRPRAQPVAADASSAGLATTARDNVDDHRPPR